MGLGPGGAGSTGGQAGEGDIGDPDSGQGPGGGQEESVDQGVGEDEGGVLEGVRDFWESTPVSVIRDVVKIGTGLLGVASGNPVGIVAGGIKAVDAFNHLKSLDMFSNEELTDKGLSTTEISGVREAAGVDLSDVNPDQGYEVREGYLVPNGEGATGEDDTVTPTVEQTLAESYGNRATATPTPTPTGGNGRSDFDTEVWDQYLAEWMGQNEGISFGEALQGSTLFRAGEAENLIGAVEGAAGQYGGLLDQLIDQAKVGTGIFTPVQVKAGANTIDFVPRANREFAEQAIGLAEKRRENALLGAKTRYDTISDRDPQSARLGFLDQLGGIASKTQDYRTQAAELADISARGYGSLANEAQRSAASLAGVGEQARQFDLNYAQRIKEFAATGEREQSRIDISEESQDPGVLGYLAGGVNLVDSIIDMFGED